MAGFLQSMLLFVETRPPKAYLERKTYGAAVLLKRSLEVSDETCNFHIGKWTELWVNFHFYIGNDSSRDR